MRDMAMVGGLAQDVLVNAGPWRTRVAVRFLVSADLPCGGRHENIGAGIGGLTTAAGLATDGHEVVVYERRDEPGAVGAGLTLFGNAFGALDAIGLGDTVRRVSSAAIGKPHIKSK